MTPPEKIITILMCLSFTTIGWALYFLERSFRVRLDAQAFRLAEIEQHIGITPLFPFDVPCPICGAGVREACYGGSFGAAHSARFEVSPAAKNARIVRDRS